MKRQIMRIILLLIFTLGLVSTLIIVNQTMQFIKLMEGIHPLIGQLAMYILLSIYLALGIYLLYFIIKTPKQMVMPQEKDSLEYQQYLKKLADRLATNPYLVKEGYSLNNKDIEESIQEAIKILDDKGTEIIKSNALMVMTTTAVSQNGRLDSVFVLITQIKMIWQLGHIYNQRPTLKDMIHLYCNVGGTVLIAREIDELDLLDEQLEPVIGAIMGGTMSGLIPGVNYVTSLIVNSVIEGSANAFLTLRVGAITKGYCSFLAHQDRKLIKKSATSEACFLLGSVVNQSITSVVKVIIKASKNAGKQTLDKGTSKVTYAIKRAYESTLKKA